VILVLSGILKSTANKNEKNNAVFFKFVGQVDL